MPEETPPADIGTAWIRTLTPYAAAYVVTFLTEQGFNADEASVNALVVFTIGTLYYRAARALEERWPQAGWLLGSPRKPTYEPKEK